MAHAAALVTVVACAWLLSMLSTYATLRYARRRGLLDQPGQRRSHTIPTPRGGGMGIVVAVLLTGLPAWAGLRPAAANGREVVALALAVVIVAWVGWRDDHEPLPIAPRIFAHIVAALLFGMIVVAPWAGSDWMRWWTLLPLSVVLVGSINAHNFMDGIDGLLGQQGVFVMLGYGVLAARGGQPGIAALASALAAGCLGFLCFNAPPARIFMGDVGSGTLGLLIGAVAVLLVQQDIAMLWPCLILSSTFLADSGMTLSRRILAGQRWHAPHRQHLYQWMVRVNWTHARTDVAYMTWNLAIATPLAWAAARQPDAGVVYCVAAYAAAIIAWCLGKRACLATARRSLVHEAV
jgi:UDP-N-acetylmuramyl pentapeptide phosphotransferase/UDP-N-acetylglucosamine-1-phosphate transferase